MKRGEAYTLLVAFQGEPGAYSEQAALEYFGPDTLTQPCHSFEDVFESVRQGVSTHGLIAIENSLAGSIHHNYDLMLHNDLHIIGEYPFRVSHCLLALPGVKLEDIRRVHSHPQALAQCYASLRALGFTAVTEADTAGSARLLKERHDQQAGALASRRAAEVYNLQILQEGMEDNPANYTRFLALCKEPLSIENPETEDYKTSIVFNLQNHPGALFKALSVFALRDIDLSKIESRPIAGHPFEYMFYIDFIGYSGQRNSERALEHLAELAPYLRILGSYPRHRGTLLNQSREDQDNRI